MNKFIIFMLCLFCMNEASEVNYTEIFQKLSLVNDLWLQATSIPEAAMILRYPPYSYYSKSNSINMNVSENLFQEDSYDKIWNGHTNDYIGTCSDDVAQIILNMGSGWALQMLDSDGKITSGILRGGLIWPGHFSECNEVYAPLDDDGHGNFHGQFCTTTWTMHLGGKYTKVPLTLGLCLPESCSEKEIKTALINITHILERFPLLKQHRNLLSLDNVSCKLKTKHLDTPAIIFTTFVSVFLMLTLVGSAVTVISYWKQSTLNITDSDRKNSAAENTTDNARKSSQSASTHKDSDVSFPIEASPNHEGSFYDKSSLTENANFGTQNIQFPPKKPDSVVKRILLCFSVFTNGQKILNTDVVDGQLLSIHGIRFLSLTWVILGHTYITSVHVIGNRLDVLKQIDSFPFQMLLQSPFSVDSFFLLSGFLLSYLFLKEASRKNGKVNWIYFYCHRLWRLTPAYMVVVFFYMLIFKYLGSGPFWDDHYCDAQRGTWWKYLLYINNFIPIHQMCVGWSWYLANDMQFYVISPLLLYPLWRWPVIGFSLLASTLIVTWTTTGVLSYTYDLIPMFVGVTETKDFSAYEEKMWNSFDLIYDKPYCRIAPYIIGIILGYVLHRLNQRKNFLNWWQQAIGWATAAFCSLSVVFGLYHVEMSRTTALFYNTLCRSSFSIGLAWLIFACETGHGGFLAKFLSWRLWIPLSRLTYCAYLVHPILIHGYYQVYQTSLFFTQLVAVTNFLGFLFIGYAVAFLFSLVFESPLMNLEKLLLKSRAK